MRKTIDNLYYGQAILCLVVFSVGLLKHFHVTPDFVTGIHMWQAWAVVGLTSIILRMGDAMWLFAMATFQGARRAAGYSFTPLAPRTFTRIIGLSVSGAAYAIAFVLPFFFILMLDQFNYIATKSP